MVNKGNHPQMALIQVSEIIYNLPRWDVMVNNNYPLVI